MQIDLPCDDAQWAATDQVAWAASTRNATKGPSFRNALRELAGLGVVPVGLSDFAMWILLHGVVSVSWTLLWRDLSDLSMVPESKITSWKDSLYRGSRSWRVSMQERMTAAIASGGLSVTSPFYWVGLPFASLAIILLLTDTEQIRIFAGAVSESAIPAYHAAC